MKGIIQVVLSCCALLFSVGIHADTEAMKMLERMGVVAKQLNYDGIFSYQTGSKLQSIRIIHRADEQGEVERLVSLNGVAREVIRTNDMVTCIYPEGKPVQENHRPLGRGFPTDLLSRLSSAVAYYQLTFGQQERVAAHHTQELIATPIDNYRYGYRLWVDKENDLLLQSDLVDEMGNILETFSFSSVEMGLNIPEQSLKPEMQGNEMSWNRLEHGLKAERSTKKETSPWDVVWLPEGFDLVAQQNRFKARNGALIEQQVYSDGLSSVSIFFEKIRARHSHLHGGSKMGAANAFGTIINAHFITVVGEVPARTVEKMGDSIRYVGDK
ncbi:MAG: transcriptional regulator [Methylophaga sp.]|nr:transcriptional regulator [Methylophaga sp.]